MRNLIIILLFILNIYGCVQTNEQLTSKKTISVIDQSDRKVKLEKIVFHASPCYGNCSAYHMQVDSNRKVQVYAELVYFDKTRGLTDHLDSTKMGHFTYRMSDESYNKLTLELQNISLDSLNFDGETCCDGQVKTIIVYYNNKRKFLQSIFPPKKAKILITTLEKLCVASELTRTSERFEIEK